MNIVKCDRCGDVIHHKKINNLKGYSLRRNWIDLDLCYFCEKQLDKFMKGAAIMPLKKGVTNETD